MGPDLESLNLPDGENGMFLLLNDVIVSDAFSGLASDSSAGVEVTFPYAGCTVMVTGIDNALVRKQSPLTD